MGVVEDNKVANPFYHNYVFGKSDLKRAIIKKWQYPFLWLLPTYVQLADKHEFHFKLFNGRIYLTKVKTHQYFDYIKVGDGIGDGMI